MNRNPYKHYDYKQISFLGSFLHLRVCKISSQLRVTTKTLKITAFYTHTSRYHDSKNIFIFLLATTRTTCPMRISGEEMGTKICVVFKAELYVFITIKNT